MDSGLLIFSIILIIIGLLLFINGFKNLKRKRLIENTPTSKIDGIAMGSVEITGKALPFNNILYKGPFSNKDCVYFHYIIQELRRSGKSSQWVTIREDEKKSPFYIKDDSGSVIVDPDGAQIRIPEKVEFESGFMKDPPDNITQFLSKNGLNYEDFLGINKTMRFIEHIICPNDELFIFGNAGQNTLVHEQGSTNHTSDIMIQKGDLEKFYLISDSSEKELLSNMNWKVIGGIYGGGILSLIGLAVTLLNLGLF